MKTQGDIPAGTGGMGRWVYTKNHVFRTQKQKGNSVSRGAFWFGSRTGGRQQSHGGTSRGYLITRSALASTFGGIVRPICLAVFRLITSSNFVGCSTGSSAGLTPLRILSTYVAARRKISASLAP